MSLVAMVLGLYN